MIKISIHQPGYIPWSGFFKKIQSVDVFVFLDDVQYEIRGWQNRNKIKIDGKEMWLTVPINNKFGTLLSEISIDNSRNWAKKHFNSITHGYAKSKYFQEYKNEIHDIYKKDYEFLIELNLDIIHYIMEKLKINTKTLLSSELGLKEQGSDRILKICKELDADYYLSGISGSDYINKKKFEESNIKLEFQDFQHPEYNQLSTPFVPNLSIIDLLFNEGQNAEKILKEARNFA